MSDFQIEKGVPAPSRANGISATLRKMEVGDSVLAPKSNAASFAKLARSLGMRVMIRSKGETTRIWRIE